LTPLEYLIQQDYSIQDYKLQEETGYEFWHTNILDCNRNPFASGFGENKNFSRKIAYSEFLERSKFREIKNSDDLNKKWGLSLIQTGCGFAAGFDESNTIYRSLGEALERWTLSKWIDENYKMQQIEYLELVKKLDSASKWFIAQFDNFFFYNKEVLVFVNETPILYSVCATVGLKNGGAFLGSSVQKGKTPNWQHSLLESFRHFLLVKNSKEIGLFPDNKVRFFSKNSNLALDQINCKKNGNWQLPKIVFHNCEYFNDLNFYLARTIVDGWACWKKGPIERFLY
jgi:hypothetical protein